MTLPATLPTTPTIPTLGMPRAKSKPPPVSLTMATVTASRNPAARSTGTAPAPKSSTNPIAQAISPTSTFISAASASPIASSAATESIITAKISSAPRARFSPLPVLSVTTLTSTPSAESARTPLPVRRRINSKAKYATAKPVTTTSAPATIPHPSAAGLRPIGPPSPRPSRMPISPILNRQSCTSL